MTETAPEKNVMTAAAPTATLACYAAVIRFFLILTHCVCKYTNTSHYTALYWYIACTDKTYQPLYSWLTMQEYMDLYTCNGDIFRKLNLSLIFLLFTFPRICVLIIFYTEEEQSKSYPINLINSIIICIN